MNGCFWTLSFSISPLVSTENNIYHNTQISFQSSTNKISPGFFFFSPLRVQGDQHSKFCPPWDGSCNQDVPTHFPTVEAFQDAGSAPLSRSHVISQALYVPLAVTHVIHLPGKVHKVSEGLKEGPMSELR